MLELAIKEAYSKLNSEDLEEHETLVPLWIIKIMFIDTEWKEQISVIEINSVNISYLFRLLVDDILTSDRMIYALCDDWDERVENIDWELVYVDHYSDIYFKYFNIPANQRNLTIH